MRPWNYILWEMLRLSHHNVSAVEAPFLSPQIFYIKKQWRIQDFSVGRQHTILPNFPKTCIKLKEFGPEGRPSRLLLDPPLKSIS